MASVSSETIASEELFKAINKSQCFIEFDMNGIIINCNQMFLDALGYTFSEVKGKHHRIFCEESYVNSQEYNKFWEKLNRGEFDAGEYKRIGKNGKKFIFKRLTIRLSILTITPSGFLSLPPMSLHVN